MKPQTDDLRITNTKQLISPDQLIAEVPVSAVAAQTVETARREIPRVLQKIDDRLIVVVGPCSIHDPDAAREYARDLHELALEHKEDLLIVMRVYLSLIHISEPTRPY